MASAESNNTQKLPNVKITASEPKDKSSDVKPLVNEFKTLLGELKQPVSSQSLSVACRMLRSPSHESVTTDLSLFSVSSIASDALGGKGMRLVAHLTARGPSPNPEVRNSFSRTTGGIPELLWFEEENDLLRSCAVLSSALGLQKSFSTSDISHLSLPDQPSNLLTRTAVSELALNSLQRSGYLLDHPRLDHTSRSCSTWVAVGDVSSTSQLPSPHGGGAGTQSQPQETITFTAADLIRSVNKTVRQNYIRRKLLTTYRALERLSQSEFNLDRLEIAAAASVGPPGPGPIQLIVPVQRDIDVNVVKNTEVPLTASTIGTSSTSSIDATATKSKLAKNLTIRDVERERGKPLSKYERNMMIFNWLHTLDESAVDAVQM